MNPGRTRGLFFVPVTLPAFIAAPAPVSGADGRAFFTFLERAGLVTLKGR